MTTSQPPENTALPSEPRRPMTRVVAIALVVAAVAVGFVLRPSPTIVTYTGPIRHVIFISLDTTRPDHFGCYGNSWIRTPNIDALAAESVLFTDYMTAASTTLASHTSLFTGTYPHTHGVPRNGFMVNTDNVMLAEILHSAGFYTAGFLGSFALDKRFDFAQGFDHYDQDFSVRVGTGGADQDQRTAEDVTNAVIKYLDETPLPANLFLFIHYFDPHQPYSPPEPYDTMYGVDGEGQTITIEDHPAGPLPLLRAPARERLCQYAGEVSYMDAHVGRLLDELRRRGILDQALLVLTSDHGENLRDRRRRPFDHGWSVYDYEVHGLCMIRLPQATSAGARCPSPTSSVDVLPTVLRYMGLQAPSRVDGQAFDLLDLPERNDERLRFAEATKPWQKVETDPRWFNIRKPHCVRRGRFKYIQTPYRNSEELYDLVADPHEHNNLLITPTAEHGALAEQLRAALLAWDEAADPLPTEFESQQHEDTMRRLRGLGYLSGASSDDGTDEEEEE